jgi:GTP cyclohydrolase I
VKTSEAVAARLREAGASFLANDNIAGHLLPGDAEALEREVAARVADLLGALVIDTAFDHNTERTAERVAKMFMREVMRGRYEPQPSVTDFPNVRKLDELYTVGPVTVRSMCSHHMVPIIGRAWFGVIPSDRVFGLSKFARLVEWVMARPQIQEEATVQLADLVERLIHPRGLALVVRASHLCTSWRGVRDNDTEMVTSVVRGAFKEKPEARAEFLALVEGGR